MDFKKYLQMVSEAESQQDVVDDMASYGAEDLDEGEVIKGPWKGSTTEPKKSKAPAKVTSISPTNDYLMITQKVANVIQNSGVRFADDPAYDIENALKKLKQKPTPFLIKKIFDEMVTSGLADELGYEVDQIDEGKFKEMSIVSVNGKNVKIDSIQLDGMNPADHPDYSDAYVSYAEFEDGESLNADEMDQLGLENPELINHLAQDLANDNKVNEEVKMEPAKKSLKDWFEQIDKEMIAEAVPTGMKPMAILDPANKDAGVGVLSSNNPAIQKLLGNLDPKDVKIVMTKSNIPTTQQKPATTTSSMSTSQQGVQTGLSTGGGASTGATAVKEEDVMEKAPPGMEKLVLKLKKEYPGKPELAFATAWKIYNKKHGKKGVEEGIIDSAIKSVASNAKPAKVDNSSNINSAISGVSAEATKAEAGVSSGTPFSKPSMSEAFGAGSTFSRSSSRLDRNKSLPATSPDSDNEKRGGEITIPQSDREAIARILGNKDEKVKEASSPMDVAKRAEQRLINLYTKAKKGEKVSAQSIMNARKAVIMTNKNSEIPSYIEDILVKEAEIPHSGPDYGAGLGAGRSATTLESQKVTEAMNTLEAAYHEGKSHGLSKHGYACRYDDGTEEHRRYHEGYKEGLDECYGLRPNQGLVDEAEMEEGNAFTAALAKTPKGGKFTVGGKSFTDTSDYDSTLDEYAFESLDKKLNALLNEGVVTEGLSVNMSQGLGGPTGQGEDTVSVTATGDDSAKLLDFIKTVGLGGLGGGDDHAEHGEEPALAVVSSDYGAPKFSGHDGMKDLMAKITGGDFEEEGGEEDHGHTCNECGMMEGDCGCEKETVDEVETPDQETDEMAEDAAGSDEEAMTTADEDSEAEEDETKPASGGATNEDTDSEEASPEEEESVEESLNEWANEAGKDGTEQSFERDIEFMTKVIAGGLNKPKSTGQTTIPVVAHQDARIGDEDVAAWKKLAGLGK